MAKYLLFAPGSYSFDWRPMKNTELLYKKVPLDIYMNVLLEYGRLLC